MVRPWEADPTADFARRIEKSALELGSTNKTDGCPDIWELSNGDYAVIGRDLTAEYAKRLPTGTSVVADERIVIIPRGTLLAAKGDIPDD